MITKEQVIAARKDTGLTPGEAALTIGASERTWASWERGERNMPPAKFALFQMLTAKEPVPT